eukprot:9500934-Pyramimonas_sp.AAC.1
MGGLNAPDWACESQMRLLAHAGSFPPERRVLNRHLAPDGVGLGGRRAGRPLRPGGRRSRLAGSSASYRGVFRPCARGLCRGWPQ